MRETKDQKIARLERKVNELNQSLRNKKLEHREISNGSKKKIEQLQQRIKEMTTLHKQEVAELRAEIQRLEKNITKEKETSRLVRAHNKVLEQEVEELQGGSEPKLSQDYLESIRYDNESRLESFGWGVPTDKWGTPFIDPDSLILHINPNTGDRLCWGAEHAILELIKDEQFYIDSLASVKDYQSAARRGDLNALEIIHKKGMEIYRKLYPNYFSKQ